MLNKVIIATLLCIQFLLTACTPIKTPDSNQYKLEAFNAKKFTNKKTGLSILISQPEAMAGYQTEQMLYIQKPYEITAFAHNTWISSPANMLYPLIMQSLQKTGYFYAVASGPYVDKADYRLDTQVIALQQNFIPKPSVIELVVKAVLTHIEDNRVVSSRIINERVNCPIQTPYGGVIAANRAAQAFTATLSKFVVDQVNHDQRHG
mgnify:CR=1 FL=1